MKIVLSNPEHPEYGVATIPFPIPRKEYDHCIELLRAMDIGDAVARDCKIEDIRTGWPVLDALKGQLINADELDYLVKCIDSFCGDEDAKFQGTAYVLGLTDVKDLINLAFCCQQATVITDFTDLEEIGKDHAMDMAGGSMPSAEYNKLNGRQIALDLINSGAGKVTPYGVIYDNGMELEELYTGRQFPPYVYELFLLEVEVFPREQPDLTATLFLPMSEKQIDGALVRADIELDDVMDFRINASELPSAIDALITTSEELGDLNEMCNKLAELSQADKDKLEAVISFVKPVSVEKVSVLIDNLDLFDYIPGAYDPYDYGRYMITESGHYEYDDNLDQYYDYKQYAADHLSGAPYEFTKTGLVQYKGEAPLEELLAGREQGMRFGGMA